MHVQTNLLHGSTVPVAAENVGEEEKPLGIDSHSSPLDPLHCKKKSS